MATESVPLRRRRIAGVLAALVLASVAQLPSHGASLPKKTFSCGQEVKRSTRLAADVGSPTSPCTHDGLRVLRGVVLDLNGHTIWGNGLSDDPGVESGLRTLSDSTVRNGTVRGFERGVFTLFNSGTTTKRIVAADNDIGVVVSGSRHTIAGVVAERNDSTGISVSGDRAVVRNSVATNNDGPGINISGDKAEVVRNASAGNVGDGIHIAGDDSLIAKNHVGANGGQGIHLDGGMRNTFERNRTVANTLDGIWIDGSDNSVLGNRSIDNANEGIQVNGANNRLISNLVSANVQDGVDAAGDGNTFKRNRTEGNVGSGIEVDGAGQTVTDNVVRGNGAAGILFDSGGGTVTGNRIIANGFRAGAADGTDDGLDADLASMGITGGGNVARANDGAACVPDVCEDRDTGLPPADLDCGAPVTTSVRLTSDVGSLASPCDDHGLEVLVPDVTIDLDGHTIHGNGMDDVGASEAGIRIHQDARVRVIDGRIHGFEMGILSTGDASKTTIDGVVISDSDFAGIQLDGPKATIVDSAVVTSGLTVPSNGVAPGILVFDPPTEISGNLASGNVQAGIRGAVADAPVRDNVSMNNGGEGILVGGLSGGGRFARNVLANNDVQGIAVSAPDAVMKKNIAVRNGSSGTFAGIDSDGDSATIVGNVSAHNSAQGMAVTGPRTSFTRNLSAADGSGPIAAFAFGTPSKGSEVVRNRVLGAVADGILVTGRVHLDRNRIHGAGDHGIEVWADKTLAESNLITSAAQHGIFVARPADKLIFDSNKTFGNGYGTPNEIGLGIDATGAAGVRGDNRAFGNDDPRGCDPPKLC